MTKYIRKRLIIKLICPWCSSSLHTNEKQECICTDWHYQGITVGRYKQGTCNNYRTKGVQKKKNLPKQFLNLSFLLIMVAIATSTNTTTIPIESNKTDPFELLGGKTDSLELLGGKTEKNEIIIQNHNRHIRVIYTYMFAN